MSSPPVVTPEILRVLGDPVRWQIVQQLSRHPELPCKTLREQPPVSKPTMSRHTKILARAGLIEARRVGRTVVYALRLDVLRGVIDDLGSLSSALPAIDPHPR